jgi:deglycosylation enzyme subunit DgpC
MKIGKIEQAISLYGFEQQFVHIQDYSFDDMFAELTALDVEKFEIIGAMAFDQYPRAQAGRS